MYSEVSYFIESLVASLLGGLCASVPIPQWYEKKYILSVVFDFPKGLSQSFVHCIMERN